jgi:hypothetical protein
VIAGRAFAVAIVAALAGCGGGGGGSASPSVVVTPPPQPDGSFTANGTNTATLTLKFPVRSSTAGTKRAPAFVSPSSTQLVVTITSYNGSSTLPSFVSPATTTIALTTTGASPNCTISGPTETCTATVPAPPGSVGYTFTLEDGSNTPLATLATTLTIVQGQANASLAVTLEGIPATVALTPPALTANTALTAPGSAITFSAADPDGNAIGGTAPYANPITLTDNDPSGATQLSVNAGTAAASVTVAKPSDVVTIQYSGLAIVPFTIAWSGTGITAGNVMLTPALQPITFSGTTPDPANLNQPTLFFDAPTAAAQTLGVSENGWTNAPYNKTVSYALDSNPADSPGYCGTGGSLVATLSPASGTAASYAATPQNDGICKVTVTDFPGGQTAAAWLAVDSTTFTINNKGRVK